MPQVCLYFQLHQPYRLSDLTIFDIGHDQIDYFKTQNTPRDNGAIFKKVADKSYIPMLSRLAALLARHQEFNCAVSVTGVFLEQAESFAPEVITLLKALAATERVEFLSETYYHTLASLYSKKEFRAQIKLHDQKIKDLFGVAPRVFRNTELVYSNEIAELVMPLNFAGILTEGVDRYLHGRDRTNVFLSATKRPIPLLLKHAELSDDIAFRFSDKGWHGFPLTAEKYLNWLEVYPEDSIINLFMDFETFGEHQWADTGIFDFFDAFVAQFLQKPWNSFKMPTQIFFEFASERYSADLKKKIYNVPEPISWADVDRDLTAWRDNALQVDALRHVYEVEDKVLATGDQRLIADWRKLQTSDHFYYMCIKWSQDGDVHAYFSPYDSPFEAYRIYSIALADLHERLLMY